MGKLDGKVAVITGGNSGMGLATAQRFAAEGAYVFITGRRQAELDKAIKLIGKNVTGVQGDVANLADLDRLYATVKEQKGKDRRPVRQRRGRRIRPARVDHRGAFRQDLRDQRQGAAVLGSEGAAAVPGRRVDHPERLDRLDQGHAGLQRLQRQQGRGAVVRPELDGRPEGSQDPRQHAQPRPD